MSANLAYRSKTLAAWLALLLGALGAHRLYLKGMRDGRAWLYPLPTLLGAVGVLRLRNLGADDTVGAVLAPLLGITLSLAMLAAIVIALTPDAKWDARYNGGQSGPAAGWGAVLAAIAGLFIGTVALLSAIAFGGQRFFEWQVEQSPHAAGGAAAADVRTAAR